MKRRTFLGLLAAAAGLQLQLKPDTPTFGIDWATGPDYAAYFYGRRWLTVDEVRALEDRCVMVDEVGRFFNVPPHLLIDDLHVHHSRAIVGALESATSARRERIRCC